MLGTPEQERILFEVLDLLEGEGISYLLTGALVRNFLGISRTSQDLDIVLHPDDADADKVKPLFQEAGYEVEGPTKGDLGRRLILRFETGWVDLWLAPDTPLHLSEFERIHRVTYEGRSVPLLHPQDYVLRKLVNYYRIRRNDDDIDDAYQVLLFAWPEIDVEALIQGAAPYRIQAEARRLVEFVRSDREQLERGETPEGI